MPSLPPRTLIFESRHYSVGQIRGEPILVVIRSSEPFVSAGDVDLACEPVQLALTAAGRAKHSLLIDSRQAPRRNDPEYESWFRPHRERMVEGMRRVAVLLASVAGKLQTERLVRESARGSDSLRLFVDDKAALEFLRSL